IREPRLRSSPSIFHPNTNRRMYIFASNGEMGEPCGMPRRLSRASVVRVFLPRSSVSSTAHSSHILIRCSTRRSTIRRATDFCKSVSEHSSELIGYPISRSLTTYCVRLELRSLPSTGITRLQRYNEPLRHPRAPGLSLAGVRLVIPNHALGFPVLRTLSLCTCCRHYLDAAAGRTALLIHPSRISLPRKGRRVGLRIVLFEACSAFTRVTACTLALSPYFVTRYPKASATSSPP